MRVVRTEQENALYPAGNARGIASSKRDKTLRLPKPKPTVTMQASSSSDAPPPPPGAGAVSTKTQHFEINKKPRAATLTRPLVPQDPITGKKRAAEDQSTQSLKRPKPQPQPVKIGVKRSGDLPQPASKRARGGAGPPRTTSSSHRKQKRLTPLRDGKTVRHLQRQSIGNILQTRSGPEHEIVR